MTKQRATDRVAKHLDNLIERSKHTGSVVGVFCMSAGGELYILHSYEVLDTNIGLFQLNYTAAMISDQFEDYEGDLLILYETSVPEDIEDNMFSLQFALKGESYGMADARLSLSKNGLRGFDEDGEGFRLEIVF